MTAHYKTVLMNKVIEVIELKLNERPRTVPDSDPGGLWGA